MTNRTNIQINFRFKIKNFKLNCGFIICGFEIIYEYYSKTLSEFGLSKNEIPVYLEAIKHTEISPLSLHGSLSSSHDRVRCDDDFSPKEAHHHQNKPGTGKTADLDRG